MQKSTECQDTAWVGDGSVLEGKATPGVEEPELCTPWWGLEQEKVPRVRRAVPAGVETAGGQTHTCKLQGFWRWKSKGGSMRGAKGRRQQPQARAAFPPAAHCTRPLAPLVP